MKKLFAGLIILVILVLATACSSSSSPAEVRDQTNSPRTTTALATSGSLGGMKSYDEDYRTESAQGEKGIFTTTITPANAPAPTFSTSGAGGSVKWDGETSSSERMVIRTGNVSLVVGDISKALDSIAQMAVDFGGYVVSSQKWKEGERNNGNISFRILSENYDKAIVSLRSMSLDVINETTNSQDVTEEYSDLGAGLKNLEATEKQLLKIMDNASKTEDILSIQRELTNVRGQIEQTKGRMVYLERTSSTSLINVNLSEAILTLKFSADRVRADIDEKILFTVDINGGFEPYNYQWDFGDGNTSIERAPYHSYKDAGVYSVSVRVTDDKGYTNFSQRTQYVTITGTWNPGNVVKSAWNGFAAFGRALINILIWIGIFSPVWIVTGGIIWFIIWRKQKKKI